RQLPLYRHVPLLRVARPEPGINGEDALSDAGTGCRTDWSDGRPVLQHERRCDVVKRPERNVLQERERRRREGRGDPGHLDPDETVARADDRLVRHAVDGAYARAEVVFLER